MRIPETRVRLGVTGPSRPRWWGARRGRPGAAAAGPGGTSPLQRTQKTSSARPRLSSTTCSRSAIRSPAVVQLTWLYAAPHYIACSGQACLARVTAATHWARLSPRLPPTGPATVSLQHCSSPLQCLLAGESLAAVVLQSPLSVSRPFYRAPRVTAAWRSSFDMQITLFIGRN